MSRFIYEGERTRTISFPLGGIGAGCVGLSGNGRLIDWEIFNRPNKNSDNGFTHFAVRAERADRLLDARVLQGPLLPPYMGEGNSFGVGPSRSTLAGAPCFERASFEGKYPVASLCFEDARFPGDARLTAFSPFIPNNDRDSSLPAAFFEVELTNTTAEALSYTVAFSLTNPCGKGGVNELTERDGAHYAQLTGTVPQKNEIKFGGVCMATDAERTSAQQYWYRGGWFDGLTMFWKNFAQPGPLPARVYGEPGDGDTATLAAHLPCEPGQTVRARFVLSWYYPNCYRYWSKRQDESAPIKAQWRNYYAGLFADAADCARYSLDEYDRLRRETFAFRDALFAMTMPDYALDAVTANLSLLKSPTCLRLVDGSFYGWEGCNCTHGCCEGTCTHVWNYAYALPYLFPKLERNMRDLDYTYNFQPSGAMPFRLQLPLGAPAWTFRACADGQLGGIMKIYREWMISGDTDWLRGLWPKVKKSIEYAWSPYNADRWDPDQTGVLWGRQHHTLDMELFSPNSWLTGFYLGALKAGAEMAEALGDADAQAEYAAMFARGKAWSDEHLFNGEYYFQKLDLGDRTLLDRYPGESANSDEDTSVYWNEESAQLKYQVGEGCAIDQVLAQWHANLMGLGELFDREQTRSALRSIYKYNYKPRMGDCFNPCRLYCLHDEAGTLICSYPEGREKPDISVPYAEETMHGFEYQAGIHMIQEGLYDEGMDVVRAVRDRYDGARRNPWNEFECGSNYARSMAAYALVPALAGFHCDMTKHAMTFNPLKYDENGEFRTVWSVDGAWGTLCVSDACTHLQVLGGELKLEYLNLPFMTPENVAGRGEPVHFHCHGSVMHFKDLTLAAGEGICVG